MQHEVKALIDAGKRDRVRDGCLDAFERCYQDLRALIEAALPPDADRRDWLRAMQSQGAADALVRASERFLYFFLERAFRDLLGDAERMALVRLGIYCVAKGYAPGEKGHGQANLDDFIGNHYAPCAVWDVLGKRSIATDGAEILDVCCGTGLVGHYFDGFAAIDGVDIAPELLGVAQSKAVYRHLWQHDVREPRNFGAYDLITCTGAMFYFGPEDFIAVLRVMSENLRPGGHAVVSVSPRDGDMPAALTFDNFTFHYNDATMRKLCADAGLRPTSYDDYGGYGANRIYVLQR